MKKIFYLILIIVIILVIGRLVNKSPTPAVETNIAAVEIAAVESVNEATDTETAIVTEDSEGNMSVDGQPVEDIEEENPEDTAGEEETIIQE